MEYLALACRPAVIKQSLRIAAVVGVLLALINHGDALLRSTVTAREWFKMGLTFLVPYGVATWSAVQTLRREAHDHEQETSRIRH